MEGIYDRQKDIPLAKLNSVIVVGLGGTGSWVALGAAMSGCKQVHLMDYDYLEHTNLNRIPVSDTNVGRKKTEVLTDLINLLRPECVVSTGGRAGAFTLTAAPPAQVLFDCTDDGKVQATLHDWADTNGVKYVRSGYNGGFHATITSRKAWSSGLEKTGYEIDPSWVVPAAVAGMLAVFKAVADDGFEFIGDIRNIGGKANVMEPKRKQ